jgi:putative cell wall-binding protein
MFLILYIKFSLSLLHQSITNIKKTMTINSKLLESWKEMYEHGDYVRIAKALKVTDVHVMNVFRFKAGSERMISGIKKFYQDRAMERKLSLLAEVKKIEKHLNPEE